MSARWCFSLTNLSFSGWRFGIARREKGVVRSNGHPPFRLADRLCHRYGREVPFATS
jgi:hypothetical protein